MLSRIRVGDSIATITKAQSLADKRWRGHDNFSTIPTWAASMNDRLKLPDLDFNKKTARSEKVNTCSAQSLRS
jgi:hypothetical protein